MNKQRYLMKISEPLKILKQHGCVLVRSGGSHDIWYSPKSRQKISLPRHRAKEIATGTADRILKEAGIHRR